MKRIGYLLLFFASVLFAQASAEVELKAATHKEQVHGDLKGAIGAYRKIVAKHGQNRAIAAQATLRMAQCHEKLGQAEARRLYQHVTEQYRDQSDHSCGGARQARCDERWSHHSAWRPHRLGWRWR